MVYGLDALMVEIINFFPLWHCWQYWLLVNVQVQGFGQGHGSSMLPQCTPYGGHMEKSEGHLTYI